ncbi:hypothetical protein M5D96_003349 [Drosophila gunungcola]|uniref:Uncharacterized protein n=1 Tax=Drosophila gunungcola TaxID=103775 RepID=A0A9Q0BSD6_9MUSC|nr:hypothetical protein M5D96_003349 [Drosophila gunungcola]
MSPINKAGICATFAFWGQIRVEERFWSSSWQQCPSERMGWQQKSMVLLLLLLMLLLLHRFSISRAGIWASSNF